MGIVTLKLSAERNIELPGVVRNADLAEVWRGMLSRSGTVLNLPSGPFIAEAESGDVSYSAAFEISDENAEVVLESVPETKRSTELAQPVQSLHFQQQEGESITGMLKSITHRAGYPTPEPVFLAFAKLSGGIDVFILTPEGVLIPYGHPHDYWMVLDRDRMMHDMIHRFKYASPRLDLAKFESLVGQRMSVPHGAMSELPTSGIAFWQTAEQSKIKGTRPPASTQPMSPRLAIWSRKDRGAWQLDTSPTRTSLRETGNYLRYLRISATKRVPLLAALPRNITKIEISNKPTGLCARVTDADERAELMARLMENNRSREAATLAASRLRGKMAEPIGAAEGAVAIVQLFEELEDKPPLKWFSNLANLFPWLPDGLVAWVWYGLYHGEIEEHDAQSGFIDAYKRGIPTTTAALMLLLDGLELANANAQHSEGPPQNEELSKALAKVRTWAAVADPSTFRTTLSDNGRGVFDPAPRISRSMRNTGGAALEALGATEDMGVFTLNLDD